MSLACGVEDCSCCGATVFSATAETSVAVVAGAAPTGWVLAAATSFGDGVGTTGSGIAAACCCGAMVVSTVAVAVLMLRAGLAEANFTGAMGAGAVSVAGVMAAGSGAGCAMGAGAGDAGMLLAVTTGLEEDEPE